MASACCSSWRRPSSSATPSRALSIPGHCADAVAARSTPTSIIATRDRLSIWFPPSTLTNMRSNAPKDPVRSARRRRAGSGAWSTICNSRHGLCGWANVSTLFAVRRGSRAPGGVFVASAAGFRLIDACRRSLSVLSRWRFSAGATVAGLGRARACRSHVSSHRHRPVFWQVAAKLFLSSTWRNSILDGCTKPGMSDSSATFP